MVEVKEVAVLFSGLLSCHAYAETVMDSVAMMVVDVATTAVSGLSYYYSAVADVAAETASAKSIRKGIPLWSPLLLSKNT